MHHSIQVHPERRLVIVRVTGHPTLEEMVAVFDDVLARAEGYDRLWDYRDARLDRLDRDALRHLAAYSARRETEPPARVGVLVAADLEFGIARAYEAWAGDHPAARRVFRDEAEALGWFD